MNARLTIGKAGRVVIPKQFRDELGLRPGDTLELESTTEKITLRPVHATTRLVKKRGVWVFRTSLPMNANSIDDLRRRIRDERDQQHFRTIDRRPVIQAPN